MRAMCAVYVCYVCVCACMVNYVTDLLYGMHVCTLCMDVCMSGVRCVRLVCTRVRMCVCYVMLCMYWCACMICMHFCMSE